MLNIQTNTTKMSICPSACLVERAVILCDIRLTTVDLNLGSLSIVPRLPSFAAEKNKLGSLGTGLGSSSTKTELLH